MKLRFTFLIVCSIALLASCNIGKYSYNDNFEEDDIYYSSNDPDEYNTTVDYVEEEIEDEYYSDQYQYEDRYQEDYYDDGGGTYITNNYYGNNRGYDPYYSPYYNPYYSPYANPYYRPYYSVTCYPQSAWSFSYSSYYGWSMGYSN